MSKSYRSRRCWGWFYGRSDGDSSVMVRTAGKSPIFSPRTFQPAGLREGSWNHVWPTSRKKGGDSFTKTFMKQLSFTLCIVINRGTPQRRTLFLHVLYHFGGTHSLWLHYTGLNEPNYQESTIGYSLFQSKIPRWINATGHPSVQRAANGCGTVPFGYLPQQIYHQQISSKHI